MRRKTCPDCGANLPYAAYWCRACGWSRTLNPNSVGGTRDAASRALRLVLATFAVMLAFVVGRMALASPAVADWYADFAFQHLPAMFSGFGPGASDVGAYYYCVKTAARQVQDHDAVETFPSLEESRLVRVEEERYRVHSHFDQQLDTGDVLRRGYRCDVRYDRGRWKLERLTIEERAAALRIASVGA